MAFAAYLKTAHNTYLSARDNGYVGQTPHMQNWELFCFEFLGNGSIALWTAHAKYVSAQNKGVVLVPQRPLFESFVAEIVGNGKIAFKTVHNTYLSARNDGSVGQMPHRQAW